MKLDIIACPGCGDEQLAKDLRCASCGHPLPGRWTRHVAPAVRRFDPIAMLLRGTPTCPQCLGRVVARTQAGVRSWACERCPGKLVPYDALARIHRSEATRRELLSALEGRRLEGSDLAPAAKASRCPCCPAGMTPTRFARVSDVRVDVCPDHGFWLDTGELERIASFIDGGGLEWARERNAREARERPDLDLFASTRTVSRLEVNWIRVAMITGAAAFLLEMIWVKLAQM